MKQTKLDAIKGGLTSPRPGEDEPDTAQLAKAAGLTLSPVRLTDIGKLKENPISAKHFRDLEGADFENLKKDIQLRGVLVPLVALRDGTLLAGHNRLRAAKEIGLEKIPVQWIEDELSKKDQATFVIKDNVLRRHLDQETKSRLIHHMLKENPELSDRLIAETLKVSPSTVGSHRNKQLSNLDSSPAKRKGKDGKERRQPAAAPTMQQAKWAEAERKRIANAAKRPENVAAQYLDAQKYLLKLMDLAMRLPKEPPKHWKESQVKAALLHRKTILRKLAPLEDLDH